MKKTTLIFPIIALAFMAGSASAQTTTPSATSTTMATNTAGILPGNPLYFLDIMGEGLINFFTWGDVAKAERYLSLSTERLAEAQGLMNEGKTGDAKSSMAEYEDDLAKAVTLADKAKSDRKDTTVLDERISQTTSKHIAILSEILNKAPEAAKAGIRNALEKSQNGHDIAVRNTATSSAAKAKAKNNNASTTAK